MSLSIHMSWILVGALALEGLVGYPNALWRIMGHPVSWMGHGLSLGEGWFNSHSKHPMRDFFSGTIWLILLITLVGGAAWSVSIFLRGCAYGWVAELLLVATLVAGRSLYDHVAAVKDALQMSDIGKGREQVALIVGRSTDDLE